MNNKTAIYCIDCGAERFVDHTKNNIDKYKKDHPKCNPCSKVGLRNSGTFKKGQVAWNVGLKRWWHSPGEIKKGQRLSPETEFKYKNGRGYRGLLLKGILPSYCNECLIEPGFGRLHIHHIDHNRDNNDISNLEVLCRPCHLARHGKKERNYIETSRVS